jgi:hypothetical protein
MHQVQLHRWRVYQQLALPTTPMATPIASSTTRDVAPGAPTPTSGSSRQKIGLKGVLLGSIVIAMFTMMIHLNSGIIVVNRWKSGVLVQQ